MEFSNKRLENTDALEQSRNGVEQAGKVDKDTLEGKLSTEQFDDDGDETSDANNPNDEESTDMKTRERFINEASSSKFSEQTEPQEEKSSDAEIDNNTEQAQFANNSLNEAPFDDNGDPETLEQDGATDTDVENMRNEDAPKTSPVQEAERDETDFLDDTTFSDEPEDVGDKLNSNETKQEYTENHADVPITEETFDDSEETMDASATESPDAGEQNHVTDNEVGTPSEAENAGKNDEVFDDSEEGKTLGEADNGEKSEARNDEQSQTDYAKPDVEEPFDDSRKQETVTDTPDKTDDATDVQIADPDKNPDGTQKRFEDYSYSELSDMARDNPSKAAELNADFRERYEAEMRGMTQEEYQDYKYRLQAAQSKEDLESEEPTEQEPLSQSEKFENIQNRVEQFRTDFDADDTTVSEDKKALGSNICTIRDINDLKKDVVAEKDACWEKMRDMKVENPYNSPETNAEYKAVADRYNALNSMEAKLKGWEAELDGKNYALCEKRDLPYYQQTEHYHNSSEQKLDKMDAYLNGTDTRNGINDRLEAGTTTPLDKFQFELQYDRMTSSIDEIKKHGSPEEKARAEKLSANLDDIKSQFEQLHTGYELKQDGTITEKTETHTNAKTLHSTGEQTRELRNGATRTSSVDIGIGGKHTKVEQEQFLYTGENTGKYSKTVVHDGFHIRSESEEKGLDKDGKEYTKSNTSEISVFRGEVGTKMDAEKGQFSVSADAALAKGRTESETEKNNIKTSWRTEVNTGHISGKISADIMEGEYKAKADASAADAEFTYRKESDEKSIETTVSGRAIGASAKAEFDKYGANLKVSGNEAEVGAELSVNDVKIVGIDKSANDRDIYSHAPLGEVKKTLEPCDTVEDLSKSMEKNTPRDTSAQHLMNEGKHHNLDNMSEIEFSQYTYVKADEIDISRAPGMNDGHFWDHKHHGMTKEDYMKIARKLPEVRMALESGQPLDVICENPELRNTANFYYDSKNMVKVNQKADGGLEYCSDGRHRIAAAQELGYEIPVEIIPLSYTKERRD